MCTDQDYRLTSLNKWVNNYQVLVNPYNIIGCCFASLFGVCVYLLRQRLFVNNRRGCVMCVCLCVRCCGCVHVGSSTCVCAQVADTLGKSFQIHLFRGLCADDTCTMLPKKCHNVSDFVCSSDPPPKHTHHHHHHHPSLPSWCVARRTYICLCASVPTVCYVFICVLWYSVSIYVGAALSNVSYSERNRGCVVAALLPVTSALNLASLLRTTW